MGDGETGKLLNSPSRMELAGWGLASLLPLAVANYVRDSDMLFGIGYLAIIGGLAAVTGRIAHSWKVGLLAMLLLFLACLFLVWPELWALPLDNRDSRPLTLELLPVPVGVGNPIRPRGSSTIKVFLSCCWFAFVCAGIVRFCLRSVSFEQGTISTFRAATVFAVFIGLHLVLVPDREGFPLSGYGRNGRGDEALTDIQLIVSVYSLLLVYAAYYVALFWDVTRKRVVPKQERHHD